ncbi:choline-sulfatase [soil metagenome]
MNSPNFLLILTDQHRPDWLGCEGKVPVRTPNVDALAARGTRFTQAHCPSPLCGPSRACLAAGVEYDACGVPNHKVDFDVSRPTYYRLLQAAGYHTAVVGKVDLNKCSGDWGIDGQKHLHEWGFTSGLDVAGGWDAISYGNGTPVDPYMTFLQQIGFSDVHVADFQARGNYKETYPAPMPEESYQDHWIAARAMDAIKALPHDQSWHLAVHFTGPHDPMDVTPQMHRWYREPPVDFPPPSNAVGTEHDQEVRRNYAAKIETIDRWLGKFIETISERGELENTVIVFSADHGEMLGDRGMWMKSRPWWQSVKIPLIIAAPGERPRVCDDPVSLIDVGATFLDFASAAPAAPMTSHSLRPALSGATGPREFVRSGLGSWRMVCDRRYKLVVGYDPAAKVTAAHEPGQSTNDSVLPMLFDIQRDPTEQHNIAAENAEIVNRMRTRLI